MIQTVAALDDDQAEWRLRRRVVAAGSFSTEQAARLSGASYRQVDYWVRNRLLMPSCSAAEPGTGGFRRFSFADVVALAMVARLRPRRARPTDRQVAPVVLAALVDCVQRCPAAQLGELRLLAVGDGVVVLDDQSLPGLLAMHGPVTQLTVVDVGRLAVEVAGAAG